MVVQEDKGDAFSCARRAQKRQRGRKEDIIARSACLVDGSWEGEWRRRWPVMQGHCYICVTVSVMAYHFIVLAERDRNPGRNSATVQG